VTLRALIRLSFFEFIRDRIVWMGIFVAILMFVFSLVLGSLSFNEQQRILAHLGWAAIQISTLGLSLILAANWLHKEMDRQTCLLVLARPVTRAQFLLGKYLPILLLTFFIQVILAICLYALLNFSLPVWNFITVLYGTFLEVAIVFTACFFIATFMSPILSFIVGVGIFLIGHWVQEVEFFGSKYKITLYTNLARFVKWFFPNLFQFNWRSMYFLEHGLPSEQILWVTLHAAGWILLLVFSATFVFRRKDLV
jgi:Cu-processing system permease protein